MKRTTTVTVTMQLLMTLHCIRIDIPFLCANTTTESVTPLFDRLIHDALLESSPCLNQLMPQLDHHIPDWYTGSFATPQMR